MTWLQHTVHMIMLCSNPKHTPHTLPHAYTRTKDLKNSNITPLHLGGRQWSPAVNYYMPIEKLYLNCSCKVHVLHVCGIY